ncbi:TetR/AcrR family transcriptional regulator [Actinoplanes sp. NPDC049265]|uniref:TetR/AcrR family transcriptional regulator n=1 Tax=Actinoplanes sp. NPDC049265 TaxID=3363902 RepID=UPI003719F79B
MRADKARNQEAVLAAAGRLFDAAAEPDEVSMDAVAAEAGVGKGTIFRGFGDRRALITALYHQRITAEFAGGPPSPSGTAATGAADALELLLRTWRFKQRNRVLALALEREGFGSPYQNEGYEWLHTQLTTLISGVRGAASADFLAHALLAAVRSDLVEHVRGQRGMDPEAGLRALVNAIFA